MNKFLKSIAVLTCTAFMFGACSSDDTTDASVSGVLTTDIQVVQPGNEWARVKWIVSSESITKCNVAWAYKDGEELGSVDYDAVLGYMEHDMLDIEVPAPVDSDVKAVVTLTVTVTGYNGSGSKVSTSTKEAEVYCADTYSSRPSVDFMFATSEGITLTWDEDIPEDCAGVVLRYYNTSGNMSYTELTTVDVPTILTDADPETSFSFVTYFLPENGLDYMTVAADMNDSNNAFPDLAPSTPSNVYVYPGKNRFKIFWDIPATEDNTYTDEGTNETMEDILGSTKVIYSNGTEEKIFDVETLTPGTTNSQIIVGESDDLDVGALEAGDYTITLYNVKARTGTLSEAVTASVKVYCAEDYSTAPSINELLHGAEYTTILWYDIADCTGVQATFTDSEGVEQKSLLTPIDELLIINDTTSNKPFYYESYFSPANGLDTLYIKTESDDLVIPVRSPATPTNLVGMVGDNKIVLEWDLENDTEIYELLITYTDQDGVSGTCTLALENLNIGKSNFYELTTAETGIEAGNEYEVELRTISASGIPSGLATSDNLIVYDLATFQDESVQAPGMINTFDPETFALSIEWIQYVPCSYVELTYSYNANYPELTKTVTITDFETTTVIADAAPGHDYLIKAVVTPYTNAIDNVTLPTETRTFDTASINRSIVDQIEGMMAEAEINASYRPFKELFDGYIRHNYDFDGDGTTEISDILVDCGSTTLSIDLGQKYKMTQVMIGMSPGVSETAITNGDAKYFSLYITESGDPVNDATLNAGTTSVADVSAWTDVFEGMVTLVMPYTSSATTDYDYNGDGVIDATDNYDAKYGGFFIDIPDSIPAFRYCKFNFPKNALGYTTNNRMQEIGFMHKGVVD